MVVSRTICLFPLLLTTCGIFVDGASLLDLVNGNPDLSTLAAAVKAAGLESVLSGNDHKLTLFAPTNLAFEVAPMAPYKMKYLLDPKNKESLVQIIKYHVAPDLVTYSKMEADATASHKVGVLTVEGSKLYPGVVEGHIGILKIHDATCSDATVSSMSRDTKASNGLLQVVDRVFVPPGAFCPDVIFAAEQRTSARISRYGYDCRSTGVTHLVSGEEKPVGLAVDTAEEGGRLFWSNDMDSPHQANTSWITSAALNGTDLKKIKTDAVDPQGLAVDSVNKKLYFTEHSGYKISRANYDGSEVEVLIEKKADWFQPADVAVDAEADLMFFTVEDTPAVNGSLWSSAMNGSNATKINLAPTQQGPLVHNYGLCLDRYHKHVFYVQGGHGGSIQCFAYGKTPCLQTLLIGDLEYPYMCQVDTIWAPYGGPTNVLFSEANRPGNITYITANGTHKRQLDVLVSDDLDAPMGVAFGCLKR